MATTTLKVTAEKLGDDGAVIAKRVYEVDTDYRVFVQEYRQTAAGERGQAGYRLHADHQREAQAWVSKDMQEFMEG